MVYQYNLIEEGWIPCRFVNGDFKFLGLREVVFRAQEIKEIKCELPPMTAAIMYLLLAILHRTQSIESDEDWESMWKAGKFDSKKSDFYFQEWFSRFDLFDERHPFYQDPKIGLRKKDVKNLQGKELQIKPVNSLILHSSSGDAATLFDHTLEDRGQIFELDEIARLLVMFQAFSLGGMTSASVSVDKYYTDSPSARGITFFIQGKNLFNSLMLNLVAKEFWRIEDSEQGKPSWEKDDPFEEENISPCGLIDFLTWQSRRIKLVPEKNNGRTTVQQMYINPGLGMPEEILNPFYNYHFLESSSGKLDKKLLRFSESKALWRDSSVLFEPKGRLRTPPESLTWANYLQAEGFIEGELTLSAYGLCTEPGKKKAFFYREESFNFPMEYLENEVLRNLLNRNMDIAKEIQSQLWGALRQLSRLIISFSADRADGRKPAAIDEQNFMNHWGAEDYFWKELEVAFYHLMHKLPENSEIAAETWIKHLQKTARRALEQAVILSGNSVVVMRAAAKAKRQLNAGLKKVINPRGKEE